MSEEKTPYVTYHDRFDDILAEMSTLHNKKGADYGGVNDPYANVRASQEFGVPPWVGALIRLNDKITRIKSFIRNGKLMNESLKDSIDDIGVYAVIMRLLYEEQEEEISKLPPFFREAVQAGLSGEKGEPWKEVKERLPGLICTCRDEGVHDIPDPNCAVHAEEEVYQDCGEGCSRACDACLNHTFVSPQDAPLCYCLTRTFDAGLPHPVHLKGYDPLPGAPRDEKGGLVLSSYYVTKDGDNVWLGATQ